MSFDVFRCLVCRRLVFFRLAGPLIVPPTQTSVEHGYWEQKGLTSALTDQGPYEYTVSGAGDDYIDLANTYLFVEIDVIQ
jgi:hypothetical protein